MKRILMTALVLSVLAGISLPAIPATAQMTPAQMSRSPMICGKRSDIVRQLGEKYGETRRSLGLSGGQGVVELYASEETGSWTILLAAGHRLYDGGRPGISGGAGGGGGKPDLSARFENIREP